MNRIISVCFIFKIMTGVSGIVKESSESVEVTKKTIKEIER